MEKIKLQEIKDKYTFEKQEIERKEGVIVSINAKLSIINETKTQIQKWNKSIDGIKNPMDKATMLQAKFDAETKIEQLETEIQQLWESINEPIPTSAEKVMDDVVQVDEQGIHRKWLNTGLFKYLGFAFVSLFLFVLIHGSQFLFTTEWTQTLESFRYTHQIFLKISMGFFGVLMMAVSVNLLLPSVLRYFNSDLSAYDFFADFRDSDPKTRLLVSCFILYCLMQYWGKIMAWEIVL